MTWTDGKNSEGIVRGRPGTRKLAMALNNCPDKQFVDLIAKCLDWDPRRRIQPAEALRHPFLQQQDVITDPKHQQFLSRSATLNSKVAQQQQRAYQLAAANQLAQLQIQSSSGSSRPQKSSSQSRQPSATLNPSKIVSVSGRTRESSSNRAREQQPVKTKSFVR